MGTAVAIAGSLIFAGSCVINRVIKDIHFSIVLFYHTIIGTSASLVVVGIYSLCTKQSFLSYNATQWGLMLLGGFFDFITVAANIVAYQNDNSAFISLVGYIQVPITFLADYLIFHQVLNWVQLLCASIIFATTITVSCVKYRQTV